ncbi:myeloblastin-like [Convolutriloba macropyga]|uniref:myeloblastin-like n=1 Tax=Convolutriloba macropyga TaxID=536237 RepID=UPI003F51F5DF
MNKLNIVSLCLFLDISDALNYLQQPVGRKTGGNLFSQKVKSAIINGIPSRQRLFYVKVKTDEGKDFCGGTIVDIQWVITAAHCVAFKEASNLRVLVGDFSDPETDLVEHSVVSLHIAEGFEMSARPLNDIALLKMTAPLSGRVHVLPLCSEWLSPADKLATCGMGTTTGTGKSFEIPEQLQEANFNLALYFFDELSSLTQCRDDNVCVYDNIQYSNICYMDDGGPLYTFWCGTHQPECLYGVASYSLAKQKAPSARCNYGSFFASVPYLYEWIVETVTLN